MAFAVVPGMQQMGDGPAYVHQVQQIMSGTIDHFYFPPGTAFVTMPVFGVFGVNVFAEHVAGTLLSIGFLLSITWLAGSLGLSRSGAFLATCVAAVYPHVLLSAAQISSLPLTAIAVSLAVGCAVRAAQRSSLILWTLAALFCGIAVLTRPGTVLLAPFLVLWTWHAGRRALWPATRMAAAVLAFVLVVASLTLPVMHFHARHGHGWTLATNSEWNLFLSNSPYTPDYKTGHFGQRALSDLDPEAERYIRGFFSGETAEGATLRQRQVMLDSARAYMVSNPVRTVWRMSNRVRGFFGCDYTAARELQLVFSFSDSLFATIMAFEGGMYLAVLFGWLIFMVHLARRYPFGRWAHLGLVGVIIAPHVVAFALAKYHLPLVPFMICATAALVDCVIRQPKHRKGAFKGTRKTLILIALAVSIIQIEHLYHLMLLR